MPTPIRRGDLEPGSWNASQAKTVSSALRTFENNDKGRELAFKFGNFIAATIATDARVAPDVRAVTEFAIHECKSLGIPLATTKDFISDSRTKAQVEYNNSAGGFLVPDIFEQTLITTREKFGVFRRNARNISMTSDRVTVPRRNSGPSGYWIGEGATINEQDAVFSGVALTSKKRGILTQISNELNEDSLINLGDWLAGEFAWQFSVIEDQSGFWGNGSSAFAGIVGMCTALTNVNATVSNIASIYKSAATSWGAVTLADFNNTVGILPEYADTPNAKWYMSRAAWGSIAQRLATNSAGNSVSDIVDGARVKSFLGYEVETSQVFPRSYASNQIVALFGDLTQAAMFGDRKSTSIMVSPAPYFAQDSLALRAVERFDINCHEVGDDLSQPPRDPAQGYTAGPIVALMLS